MPQTQSIDHKYTKAFEGILIPEQLADAEKEAVNFAKGLPPKKTPKQPAIGR